MKSFLFLFGIFCANFAFAHSAKEVENAECMFKDNVAVCCLKLKAKVLSKKFCLETTLDLEKTEGKVRLYIAGLPTGPKELVTGKTCWSLPPPLSSVQTCVDVYHLILDTSRRLVESCAVWNVAKIKQIRFDCVRFENGTWTHHAEIQPEDYDIKDVIKEKIDWAIKGATDNAAKAGNFFKKGWEQFKKLFQNKKPTNEIQEFVKDD